MSKTAVAIEIIPTTSAIEFPALRMGGVYVEPFTFVAVVPVNSVGVIVVAFAYFPSDVEVDWKADEVVGVDVWRVKGLVGFCECVLCSVPIDSVVLNTGRVVGDNVVVVVVSVVLKLSRAVEDGVEKIVIGVTVSASLVLRVLPRVVGSEVVGVVFTPVVLLFTPMVVVLAPVVFARDVTFVVDLVSHGKKGVVVVK